jgi:hypothetical protein
MNCARRRVNIYGMKLTQRDCQRSRRESISEASNKTALNERGHGASTNTITVTCVQVFFRDKLTASEYKCPWIIEVRWHNAVSTWPGIYDGWSFSSSASIILLHSTSNGRQALPTAGTRFLWKAKHAEPYVPLMIVGKCEAEFSKWQS